MKIKITEEQREEILKGQNGTGYMIYKSDAFTTCEVSFYITICNGMPIPHMYNGKPVEYDIADDSQEDRC